MRTTEIFCEGATIKVSESDGAVILSIETHGGWGDNYLTSDDCVAVATELLVRARELENTERAQRQHQDTRWELQRVKAELEEARAQAKPKRKAPAKKK